MTESVNRPKPQIIWVNLTFFIVTGLLTVIGVPLYLRHQALSASEIALFLFYVIATGMSITVGYHRLFAHATFKANRFVQFLVLFFGAAAFEQSAMDWASQHRDHHRYVDTDQDPYSIKKGFFYAHIGWLIFWKHHIDHSNAKDLQKNPLVAHQNRHYHLWAIVSGILLPLAIGALTGHLLGALLFSVAARLTLVYHSTFCINSVCHMFGKPTYDIHSSAKDHWFVAFLTNGEGYHNFHHRFPTDYRNGVRWYDWDPSKWMILALSKIGWAWDLKRVSKFSILEARLAAENQILQEKLSAIQEHPHLEKFQTVFKTRYALLLQKLSAWETSTKEHQALIMSRVAHQSDELQKALARMREARMEFVQARSQWVDLSKTHLLDLPLAA